MTTTKSRPVPSGMGRYDSEAFKREQELCVSALATSEFDNLSDNEWVAMCEEVARQAIADASGRDDGKPEGAGSRSDKF